jgi:hypothetical protein
MSYQDKIRSLCERAQRQQERGHIDSKLFEELELTTLQLYDIILQTYSTSTPIVASSLHDEYLEGVMSLFESVGRILNNEVISYYKEAKENNSSLAMRFELACLSIRCFARAYALSKVKYREIEGEFRANRKAGYMPTNNNSN